LYLSCILGVFYNLSSQISLLQKQYAKLFSCFSTACFYISVLLFLLFLLYPPLLVRFGAGTSLSPPPPPLRLVVVVVVVVVVVDGGGAF